MTEAQSDWPNTLNLAILSPNIQDGVCRLFQRLDLDDSIVRVEVDILLQIVCAHDNPAVIRFSDEITGYMIEEDVAVIGFYTDHIRIHVIQSDGTVPGCCLHIGRLKLACLQAAVIHVHLHGFIDFFGYIYS